MKCIILVLATTLYTTNYSQNIDIKYIKASKFISDSIDLQEIYNFNKNIIKKFQKY
jgi:hypothetical protein